MSKKKNRQQYSDLSDKTFGVWGLAFKPKTDDTREATSLTVCKELIEAGAKIQAFDPEAIDSFSERFGQTTKIVYTSNNYESIKDADALIICTEWNEFRRPNYGKMKEYLKYPVVFDGRNIFDVNKMKEEGFIYNRIGRKLNKGIKL